MAKKKPPAHFGRPPSSYDAWNDDPIIPKDVIAAGTRILQKIEMIPARALQLQFKFVQSIQTRVNEIIESIHAAGAATKPQQQAFETWEAAIDSLISRSTPVKSAAESSEVEIDE